MQQFQQRSTRRSRFFVFMLLICLTVAAAMLVFEGFPALENWLNPPPLPPLPAPVMV